MSFSTVVKQLDNTIQGYVYTTFEVSEGPRMWSKGILNAVYPIGQLNTTYIQWNLLIRTPYVGTSLFVLCREVVLFQR